MSSIAFSMLCLLFCWPLLIWVILPYLVQLVERHAGQIVSRIDAHLSHLLQGIGHLVLFEEAEERVFHEVWVRTADLRRRRRRAGRRS